MGKPVSSMIQASIGPWRSIAGSTISRTLAKTFSSDHAAIPDKMQKRLMLRSRPPILRLDGHAAHDDGSYMDQAQLNDYIAERDPIERMAARLRLDGLSEGAIESLRTAAAGVVTSGLQAAENSPAPDPATILDGVYATRLT